MMMQPAPATSHASTSSSLSSSSSPPFSGAGLDKLRAAQLVASMPQDDARPRPNASESSSVPLCSLSLVSARLNGARVEAASSSSSHTSSSSCSSTSSEPAAPGTVLDALRGTLSPDRTPPRESHSLGPSVGTSSPPIDIPGRGRRPLSPVEIPQAALFEYEPSYPQCSPPAGSSPPRRFIPREAIEQLPVQPREGDEEEEEDAALSPLKTPSKSVIDMALRVELTPADLDPSGRGSRNRAHWISTPALSTPAMERSASTGALSSAPTPYPSPPPFAPHDRGDVIGEVADLADGGDYFEPEEDESTFEFEQPIFDAEFGA